MKRVIDIVQEWRRNPDIAYDTYQPVDEQIEWLEQELRFLENINVYYMQPKCYNILDNHKQEIKQRIKVLKGERE
jgi:hypothetical protein